MRCSISLRGAVAMKPIRYTFPVGCAPAASGAVNKPAPSATRILRRFTINHLDCADGPGYSYVMRADAAIVVRLRPKHLPARETATRPARLCPVLRYDSITSSARSKTELGILTPSALAVFRLIASSNFV